MKKILKNILNFFNYEITTKDSWYKRQENYIAEISNEENEILNNFKKRIQNDLNSEFIEAKDQVKKIASFRLKDILSN